MRHLPLAVRLAVIGIVSLFGVVVGILVTLHHRSVPPWGVVVALAVLLAFGVGLRLTTPGRGATLAGLLAMIGAQFVLAAGNTTSVVVSQGVLGYVFTLGTVLIALIVLAWPDVSTQASPVE